MENLRPNATVCNSALNVAASCTTVACTWRNSVRIHESRHSPLPGTAAIGCCSDTQPEQQMSSLPSTSRADGSPVARHDHEAMEVLEVLEVLGVEGCQRNAVTDTAGGDPRVVLGTGTSALGGVG